MVNSKITNNIKNLNKYYFKMERMHKLRKDITPVMKMNYL